MKLPQRFLRFWQVYYQLYGILELKFSPCLPKYNKIISCIVACDILWQKWKHVYMSDERLDL